MFLIKETASQDYVKKKKNLQALADENKQVNLEKAGKAQRWEPERAEKLRLPRPPYTPSSLPARRICVAGCKLHMP